MRAQVVHFAGGWVDGDSVVANDAATGRELRHRASLHGKRDVQCWKRCGGALGLDRMRHLYVR